MWIENLREKFGLLLTSHQLLIPRQLRNGMRAQEKFLLIDIKYSLFSLSSLVMDPRKCFVCLSPKCSVPLGCLPASNRWSLTCSHWPHSCWQTLAGPGHPHIHRHRCQGTGNTLTHFVPHSAYTGKGNTYPAASICRGCLQNAQNLPHRGAEDGKSHHVYNTRTVPFTWRGHSICQLWFPLFLVEYWYWSPMHGISSVKSRGKLHKH